MRLNRVELTGESQIVRAEDGGVIITIPIRVRKFSGRRTIVVPHGVAAAAGLPNEPTALQTALARGHRWLRQIESGEAANLAEIAKREKVDRSYVSRMVNLAALAPDIVEAILDETLPDDVSLFDLAVDTPLAWEDQRRKLAARPGP